MRRIHRLLALAAILFGLHVGTTGVLLQSIDLRAVLGDAGPHDPTIRAIGDGGDGPPNFKVIAESDDDAPPLPARLDPYAAFATVMRAARAAAPAAPIGFVELRMHDGRPVGQVGSEGRIARFDAVTGAVLAAPDLTRRGPTPPRGPPALRSRVKDLHRMTAFGDVGAAIFLLVALVLSAAILSGVVLHFQLLRARVRVQRRAPFWSAGGWWRTMHRAVSIAAALVVVPVVLSGTLLAIGDLGVSVYRIAHHGARPGLTADVSSPLADAEIAPMLRTTLAASRSEAPGTAIRVLRLRHFAGMTQGVVVTGGRQARQLAFDASRGTRASLSGPNYPATGQPFGWQEDQIVKRFHRGDMFGTTGRMLSLLAGFSLLFLAVSGGAMYLDMWSRRRRTGRHALI